MTANTYRDLVIELEKQDGKWGSHRSLQPEKWAVILGEEFGEVCEAVCEHDLKQARKELIQVAAVAVQAIESLDLRISQASAKAAAPNGDVKPKVAKVPVATAGKTESTLV